MTQFWQQKNVKDILQLQRDYLSEYSPLWVRTVFRILIQFYVSIKMKENESKSKQN